MAKKIRKTWQELIIDNWSEDDEKDYQLFLKNIFGEDKMQLTEIKSFLWYQESKLGLTIETAIDTDSGLYSAEMDISTISRSTRGKYVDTSFGIFELKSFFTDSAQKEDGEVISTNVIKQVLKELIDSENKKKPLNDEKLSEKLKAVGYNVARRTVAKYREQLNYPVARLRREIK